MPPNGNSTSIKFTNISRLPHPPWTPSNITKWRQRDPNWTPHGAQMEPTWTKNEASVKSTGDKLRADSVKAKLWNTLFHKTKFAHLLPKSTPKPRGITTKCKCDFDCTFLTSLTRTRRRVLLLASGIWPGLGGTRVA